MAVTLPFEARQRNVQAHELYIVFQGTNGPLGAASGSQWLNSPPWINRSPSESLSFEIAPPDTSIMEWDETLNSGRLVCKKKGLYRARSFVNTASNDDTIPQFHQSFAAIAGEEDGMGAVRQLLGERQQSTSPYAGSIRAQAEDYWRYFRKEYDANLLINPMHYITVDWQNGTRTFQLNRMDFWAQCLQLWE